MLKGMISLIKQVIVMRKDLKMRKGKMIAQGAHASLKVFLDRANLFLNSPSKTVMSIDITPEMRTWLNSSFTKIVVYVNSEEELLSLHDKAKENGLPVALIKDLGFTEFKEPTYTCFAVEPADAKAIDKITGHLPLL